MLRTKKVYRPVKYHVPKKRKEYKKASLFGKDDDFNLIKVKFRWSLPNLNQIKVIVGRLFYEKEKYWTIPLTIDNYELLKGYDYAFTNKLSKWYDKETGGYKVHTPTLSIPGLNGKLREYQEEGVRFIDKMKGRALIADEMGLGKTIQVIAWMQLHFSVRPAVIICPASLKLNWKEEVKKWMSNSTVQVINGTKSSIQLSNDIIIINYDILAYWVTALKAISPKIVVMDEIHYIKNPKTKRTKAIKKITKGIDYIIGLSGTPIENRPVEIYTSVNLINPTIFKDGWSFKHKYCGARHTGFGWDFSGHSEEEELHEILTQRVMIRRKKKDVLKELPDKVYSRVTIPISNAKEYATAEYEFVWYLQNTFEKEILGGSISHAIESNLVHINENTLHELKQEVASKANPLSHLSLLKVLSITGKLSNSILWIENFLTSGEKLVIFAEHIFVIDELMTHFGNIAVSVKGSTSSKQRHLNVKAFQEREGVKLFIGNKAASVGFTLTAASNVVHLEFPDTPGDLNQRTDRCHRIGQKNAVNVYYLLGAGTIDKKILRLLREKQIIIDSILDGEKINTDFEVTKELINSFRKLKK